MRGYSTQYTDTHAQTQYTDGYGLIKPRAQSVSREHHVLVVGGGDHSG